MQLPELDPNLVKNKKYRFKGLREFDTPLVKPLGKIMEQMRKLGQLDPTNNGLAELEKDLEKFIIVHLEFLHVGKNIII